MTNIYIYIYIYIYICMYMNMRMEVQAHMLSMLRKTFSVHINIPLSGPAVKNLNCHVCHVIYILTIWIHTYICIYIYIYLWIVVIFVYFYTYMYIYIYIYITALYTTRNCICLPTYKSPILSHQKQVLYLTSLPFLIH